MGDKIQQFINANLNTDLHSLLLKKSPFPEVSMQEIVQQIKGKQVAQKKFPFLLKDGIIFPPQVSLEQSSSEKTAVSKAQFLKGKKFVDLTSGFGIDAYYLSENFDEITLVEQNPELLQIVEHNWNILEKKATFINQKLEDFLSENKQTFDVIYLDPARRDNNKNKVFLLEDLSPNILEIQDKLLSISKQIVIKLSPLIDLKYLFSVLKNVSRIDIIAVKNDVKEIVVFLSVKNFESLQCHCINLESEESDFKFEFGDEENAVSEYSEPEKFIYIPNNTLLKAGIFNLISEKFNLKKLHPNTHIYTSNIKLENFPGRIFEMEVVDGKQIKKKSQYNIISKNYPLKPEEIKKKYGLKDGGNDYLIFTQSKKGKLILKSV
ncbi:Ribosomal RNA small subunit methyltransferase J [Chryseobacterium aquaeductus]|uniref:Ribosomal RNA small subunit methyltransferase J n=1 Tax=Chryseobacterium aquaeductus TaxID=2675056 RepID=A0A9N8MIM5_9FLAO|nr:class I SAM-dependent methyltransferase [Chryseobacterium aquaeductus]CAA7332070.1 Ribosomal RNA small subunit methyltransferase J [Chryseobacterium potabilaquae]CAD7814350.1 Ribosomal RNA small subunit methyltransferase J [Chryseobacterium aquaeductus]